MMDFLDPKKSRARMFRLYLGYVLVAVALALATVVLLYQANGFGVSKGKVVQNGLVFVSSSPSGASISLNGEPYDDNTNARMILQSGSYTMRLSREGYRDWQRAVTVEGGSVDRFDYPLLIPQDLQTEALAEYAGQPPLATQSPDRRWLIVRQPGQNSFDVYDLRDPERIEAQKATIALPAAAIGLSQAGVQTYELVEWSRDNNHVLLRHVVGEESEYIMMRRDNPAESFNLTRRLQLPASATVLLQDKKADRYFIHDTATGTLSTANLEQTAPAPMLTGVIDYKSYGNDVVVYATNDGASQSKTYIKLLQDGKSYPVRQVAAADKYLLDISTYGGDWYVALGSPLESNVYIYMNPAQKLQRDGTQPLVPVEILKLVAPNYIEFSASSQHLMAQNGQNIAVFDAENESSYVYQLDRPIDPPQANITWMDGNHLRFVSGGNTTILDYDGSNVQTLAPASAQFLPFFDTVYQNAYNLVPLGGAAEGRMQLTATPLRTAQDR